MVFPKIWNLIDSGPQKGEINMSTDLELVEQSLQNKILPTIRFYSWQPNAISLGFHQPIKTIDIAKCEKNGIDVVRRPTGGSAVFHSEELTYSVIFPSDNISVQEIYSKISKVLISSLREIGIEAECINSKNGFSSHFEDKKNISCFSSASKYEIQFNGKKIIGSAQRLFRNSSGRNVILQHGSILLGSKYLEISEYFNYSTPTDKIEMENKMIENTNNISSICGRNIFYEEIKDRLINSFKKEWSINFETELEGITDRQINL
ncbi:MAG: lipoate--protein ligase family protein [Ignavibacteria bacterium]|nr:lipoate--protein ligase family protein [Ignavibacteria bacterium]